MKIIFAQGNPGKKYESSRHNVGFRMVDRLAYEHGVRFAPKAKFFAEIAELALGEEKVLLVKPQTYYNETGKSARAIVDFYKCDPTHDFLTIYDDLALPFGTIRTRLSGRDAGNNGVKSLNSHIGIQHARIRIGIYNSLRDQIHDADFVLASFTPHEKTALPLVYKEIARFVDGFIKNSFVATKIAIEAREQA